MKLHLPKKLFTAVMACMATFSGLSTTVGTGLITGGVIAVAFVAQEARAADYGEASYTQDFIVGTGEELHLNAVGNQEINGTVTLNGGTLASKQGDGNFGDNRQKTIQVLTGSGSVIDNNWNTIWNIQALTGTDCDITWNPNGTHWTASIMNINGGEYSGSFTVKKSGATDRGPYQAILQLNEGAGSTFANAALKLEGTNAAYNVAALAINTENATVKSLSGNSCSYIYAGVAPTEQYAVAKKPSGSGSATLTVTGADSTFSGEIGKNVTLNITGGTQVISGATLGSTVQVGTGAALKLSGTITLADSLLVANESAENGFAYVSATVTSGDGIVDSTEVTWYAQKTEKEGSLTDGVFSFTSTVYDIKKADSEVSSADEATAGATGFNITGSGSILTLKNIDTPANLPYGVVINVGNEGSATIVLSEGCDWTAAEADTILDKQSGSYELTVQDGAKLSFTEYKDLGTDTISVADGGVLELNSCASGWAWYRGTINVDGEGTLILSNGDSLGWSGADPTKAINIKGTAAEGETAAKIAVVEVTGKQTLSTNINLSGNTHIQDAESGQFEFFGGIISASGTNNIIDVDIKTCRTGEFAVNENASLTLNGDIIQGQKLSDATHIINKTGKGELQLKGNSTVHAAFNLQEGSLALLNNMAIEQGGSLVASSGTSLQLGASIINKGTVDIFNSALSIDSYGHFKQYGEGEGTITFSRDGTDGFESITGLEYYLIEGSGGEIAGTKPTQIGNYTITYNDKGDAIISGGSFVTGNIYQVNTKDITLTADEISHATGYVVADGKAATVTGAKGDITTVSLGAESTLNIGGAANEPLSIKNSFTSAGKGYLNVTGGDVTLSTSISGENANVELDVTGGFLTINSCNAKIIKTTVAADATLILNASYSNSSASIAGEATVYGTMVFAAGDATGWEGNSGCLTKINLGDAETAGGILQIDTIGGNGNNQTLGNTVINMYGGTIVGKATSTLDLFNGGSAINVYSVNGTAEAPTESTITLGLLGVRQNDTKFMVAENARLIVNAVIDDGSDNNDEGDNKLTKLGAGEMLLSKANTYTGGTEVQAGTLVAATGASLGTGGVTISGGKLEITNAGNSAKVEVNKLAASNTSASITDNGESGVEGANTGEIYGIGYTNYTIENAEVAVTSQNDVTISNRLMNVALTNSGTRTVTAGNGYNYYTDINAINGNIHLKGIGTSNNVNTQKALNSLAIGDGKIVGAHSTWKVDIYADSNKATLTVAETATFGKNATLNANLTLGGGALREITPVTLTLNGTGKDAAIVKGNLTLTKGNLTLSGDVLNALAEIEAGERLTIMTIGENLIVNGQVITESITADSVGYSLAEVFTNEGYDDFYLGFDYVPADEAGYSTVYIGMIVPEPTTATLSLLALAALAARRRRR